MSDPNDKRFLTEDEATQLWRRAAELQAEAARRLEDRSRELAPRSESGDAHPGDGYALDHVRAAAVEAGISAEFVDYAVAELRNERKLAIRDPDLIDRAADRVLGHPPNSAEVTRVIAAPPERVFQAMQRVFPAEPYSLVLKDTQGGDLLSGGVLVFEVPAWRGVEGTTSLSYQARGWADIRQLYVSMTTLDTDPVSCELTIRTPLRHSRRINFTASAVISGLSGGGAAIGGVALGLAAAGAIGAAPLVAGGIAAMTALGLGSVVGGGAMLFYRPIYRYGLRKGLKALEELLAAVDVGIRTGWTFSAPTPEAPSLPPGEPWAGGRPASESQQG